MKELGPIGGGRVPGMPPLDPPMYMCHIDAAPAVFVGKLTLHGWLRFRNVDFSTMLTAGVMSPLAFLLILHYRLIALYLTRINVDIDWRGCTL